MTLDLVGLAATLACALFAGAAVYINLVEHPARLSCGTEIAARQWAPSYRRATVMQASLAVVAAVAGLARWLGGGGPWWAVGALAIGAVVPFTLLVVARTNRQLLEPGRDLGSPATRDLLVTWGRLHAVRSLLSVVATLAYLIAVSR
jgi:hypothetical protein